MNYKLLSEKDPERVAFLSPESTPSRKIIAVASIAAGSQFTWALQFSLLTPYVQLLGIPHAWASLIWLCGPISGMVVQPIVGYHSDRSTSRFGRRSPFIAAGAAAIATAVLLIGYAADIGHLLGDQIGESLKTRAVVVFVVGFWVLDLSNNMLQGPCRALLADLSNYNQKKTRTAYALFSFFMAVGFFLGYAAGSYGDMYKMLPFTKTEACDVDCANLKTCFFMAVALVLILTITALTCVKEKQWCKNPIADGVDGDDRVAEASAQMRHVGEIFVSLKVIDRPTWILLVVTFLNNIGYASFMLYDTDWMGREVYGGDTSGSATQVALYDLGVRAGATGLMIGAVVLGVTSLSAEIMTRVLGKVKILWGIGNLVLAICLALTVLISKLAELNRKYIAVNDIFSIVPSPPSGGIKAAALTLLAVVGFPTALILIIPFAMASIYSDKSGAGQGLSLGIINLAISLPQLIMSCTSGPLDALFGGGNLPAFVVGAVATAISGILALTILPSPPTARSCSTCDNNIPVTKIVATKQGLL